MVSLELSSIEQVVSLPQKWPKLMLLFQATDPTSWLSTTLHLKVQPLIRVRVHGQSSWISTQLPSQTPTNRSLKLRNHRCTKSPRLVTVEHRWAAHNLKLARKGQMHLIMSIKTNSKWLYTSSCINWEMLHRTGHSSEVRHHRWPTTTKSWTLLALQYTASRHRLLSKYRNTRICPWLTEALTSSNRHSKAQEVALWKLADTLRTLSSYALKSNCLTILRKK